MTAGAREEGLGPILAAWDTAPLREEPESDDERAIAAAARAEAAGTPEGVTVRTDLDR